MTDTNDDREKDDWPTPGPNEPVPAFDLDEDEQELEYEDELRAAYDERSSPDNQDITFVAPE
jgi:hypothetical protein